MKRKLLLLTIALAFMGAQAFGQYSGLTQAYVGLSSNTGAQPGMPVGGYQAGLYQLTFVASGTVSTCTVKLQDSPDNVTYTDRGSSQTCTSSGTYSFQATPTSWVRLNVTAQTGSGNVTFTLVAVPNTPVAVQTPSGSTLNLPTIVGGLTASGSVANDFSGSTGAFKPSTGTFTFGAQAVAATAGANNFDLSASSGTFKTPTGTATLGGAINITGGGASLAQANLAAVAAPTTSLLGDVWNASAGQKTLTFAPVAVAAYPVVLSPGSYQGTTPVGDTDTNFHALIAAASDVKLNANTLNVAKKVLHVTGNGVYTNGAASLLNARVDLCTISGCATGTDFAAAGCAVVTTNQANNLTNGQFTIDCQLTMTSTLGATATAMAKSTVCANLGATTAAVLSCFADTVVAVSATFDTTVDEFVNISFKFTSSNAANTITLDNMKVEILN